MTTATKAGGAVLQYGERDTIALDMAGGYAIRHRMAMTAEALHSKSDIADELGWRDQQIDELRAEVERKSEAIQRLWRERDAALAEVIALKAKQIDVEAVMRLADDYAGENYKAARFGGHYCHDRAAAREALRASLLGDGGTL